jgi:hypothetical protein
MPGYSVAAANDALNSLDATGTPTNKMAVVNLATGDPGTTGANEATSTPQACAWNAAASRAKTNSTAMTFTGQASATAHTHFLTKVSAAGAFGISGALASGVTAATITVASGAISIGA